MNKNEEIEAKLIEQGISTDEAARLVKDYGAYGFREDLSATELADAIIAEENSDFEEDDDEDEIL